MKKVVGYTLKNKETSRVLFAIVVKVYNTIDLRTNGVINVDLAMQEHLCVAVLL